ncbi:MAG: homogentisate phytyltransferase, partial [Leptolyngbyaceae cyanobacterium MO_188.B28]|nr:homogentisate phytyltransferase [Leptolyngbyaceae cyanobacterium MO_188.B28]
MSKTPPKRPTFSYRAPAKLNLFKTPVLWLSALWKFSRPHTIIGTSLSVFGLFAITWATAASLGALPAFWKPLSSFSIPLLALLACLCGNVYIVGLNQLEDVEIDRINKPHLPLASGEFSHQEGVILVSTAGALAIALAISQGPFLFGMVGLSLALGTAYSLPPMRLKRFPFWASFCILTVRGAIVNLGLFLHYGYKFGLPMAIPAKIWALMAFILIFSIAIAIFKDIPDIEGDRRYNITTFTVQLGQRAVFNIARAILTICYAGMALMGSLIPGVNPLFLAATHLFILGYCWLL